MILRNGSVIGVILSANKGKRTVRGEDGHGGLMEGDKEEIEELGLTTQELYIIGNLGEAPELQGPSRYFKNEM